MRVESSHGSAANVLWVVVPAATTAPVDESAVQALLAGSVAVAKSSPAGEPIAGAAGGQKAFVAVTVSGLSPSVSYKMYAVLESGGVYSAVSDGADIQTTEAPAEGNYSVSDGAVVSLSPNPVEDVLSLVSPSGGVLLVYSLSGAVLDSYDVVAGRNTISFVARPSGVYVLRVVFAGGGSFHRVVKR